MKKTLIAVSFGTSHMDTLEKTILRIEQDLAAANPDRTLYRAFTSRIIVRKLKKEGLLNVDSVPEALNRAFEDGCTDVILQPSHIINGEEYEQLCEEAEPFRARFEAFRIGTPLLTSADDYRAFAEAVLAELPAKQEGCAIALMGHGSEHYANAAYSELNYMIHDMGRTDVQIATVEGYPGFDELLRRLAGQDIRRVICLPLLIVAGDHARNDMSGDEPDSWKSRLQGRGYEVECILKGLGEYPGIRKLICAHAK